MKKSLIFIFLSLLSVNLFAFEELGSKNYMQKISTPENKIVVFYVPEDPNSQDMNKTLNKMHFKDVKVYFVHAGKNRDLTIGMGIQNVPTTLYFKGNQLKGREIGAKEPNEIKKSINKYFKQ